MKPTTKIVDTFSTSYWNSIGLYVYANNILLEESIQLNYQVIEQIRPYMNYADYTASRIYHGARTVNGEITLNFRTDGYMMSLLDYLSGGKPTLIPSIPATQSVVPLTPVPGAGLAVLGGLSQLSNPTTAANYVAARKQQISTSEPSTKNTNTALFETTQSGFNIDIIFGAKLDSAQIITTSNLKYSLLRAPNDGKTWMRAGTGVRLVGVELQGGGRSIGDDGRPINETYSFVARDIQAIKNINSSQSAITKSIQAAQQLPGTIKQ